MVLSNMQMTEALVRGWGWQSPPKAEARLAFRRSMEAANLLVF